jgi:hypothetical protein
MTIDEMLQLVALCFAVWVTTAFGAVSLARSLYVRWVARLMREQASASPAHVALAQSSAPPAVVVSNDVTPRVGEPLDAFRKPHRARLAIYLASGVVYALVFGGVWISKIAYEDHELRELSTYLASPLLLLTAAKVRSPTLDCDGRIAASAKISAPGIRHLGGVTHSRGVPVG